MLFICLVSPFNCPIAFSAPMSNHTLGMLQIYFCTQPNTSKESCIKELGANVKSQTVPLTAKHAADSYQQIRLPPVTQGSDHARTISLVTPGQHTHKPSSLQRRNVTCSFLINEQHRQTFCTIRHRVTQRCSFTALLQLYNKYHYSVGIRVSSHVADLQAKNPQRNTVAQSG